jgi:hypothetical protein
LALTRHVPLGRQAGGLTEPAYSARRPPRGKQAKIGLKRPEIDENRRFLVILGWNWQFGKVGACPPRAERIAEASAIRRGAA